eukprot:7513734-Pyramimonas_sp.AAC.1
MMLRPGAINKRAADTSKHGVGSQEDNEKPRVANFNLAMFKLLLLVRMTNAVPEGWHRANEVLLRALGKQRIIVVMRRLCHAFFKHLRPVAPERHEQNWMHGGLARRRRESAAF